MCVGVGGCVCVGWGEVRCVEGGGLHGQPAETTCKEHPNWYSGQGCHSFSHAVLTAYTFLSVATAPGPREFLRRQRQTRPLTETPVNPRVHQH